MDCLDRILAECETRGLQMTVVQGGSANGADAISCEWAFHNDAQLVTPPVDWDQHTPDICLAMVRCRQAATVPILYPGLEDGGCGRAGRPAP